MFTALQILGSWALMGTGCVLIVMGYKLFQSAIG